MKKLLFIVGLGIALSLSSSCGKGRGSPRIVCNLGGKVVPTAFTFDEFKQTLAVEHGKVQAIEYDQLKTKSLAVFFKPLENGTVLAERVILLKHGKQISPAILFGLTNEASTTAIVIPFQKNGSNVPSQSSNALD